VGNLLGPEQHGHIAAVGYDLYVKMLEKAVRKAKKQEIAEEELPEAAVDLGFEARVPERYVSDLRSRVEVYRRIASCGDAAELEGARREIADRFGPPPAEVEDFLLLARVKQLARRHRFTSVAIGHDRVVVKYLDRARAGALSRRARGFRIVDERTAHVDTMLRGAALARELIELMEAANPARER
jgi:transcription-repair coupling factor (superfamily II helicase)